MSRAILTLVFCLVLAGIGSAETYVIEPDGTGDFATIQAAATASEDGDFIELANGAFTGDGNRNVQDYLKEITIRSQSGDPSTCTINPERGEGLVQRAMTFYGTPTSFLFENITFIGGSALDFGSGTYGGAMIFYDDSSPTITGCVFIDNHAGCGGAIFMYERCNPAITNCLFANNTANGFGGAISMSVDSAPTVEYCTFYGNSADELGGALSIWNGATPTFRNWTLYGNSAVEGGGGVWCRWAAAPVFENTIIAISTAGGAVTCEDVESDPAFFCCNTFDNEGGDLADCNEGLDTGNDNISEDSHFVNAGIQDFHLLLGSLCLPFSEPNPACDLIGAWGHSDTGVEVPTWGAIKAGYSNSEP